MAYQIPYNQPRIYVNYASWLQRIGAITRNSMFYYRDGSSQSVGSDWSFHSSSNQTKSGIWELEPHNYYRLFPSLELADYAGDYNTFYMRQYVSEQVEDVNGVINPIYNVRSRLLNNVLESMEYDGNGYFAMLGSNLFEKGLMCKFVLSYYVMNAEKTDYERNADGTIKTGHATMKLEPLYNCTQNAGGYYIQPNSNGTFIAKITNATTDIRKIDVQSINCLLLDKNYVWDNPDTVDVDEGVSASALQGGTYDDIKIGSISYGTYWDFPVNCDMNLNFTRDYKGVKASRSLGGYDTTNINYTGAPAWGTGSAWEDELQPYYPHIDVVDGVADADGNSWASDMGIDTHTGFVNNSTISEETNRRTFEAFKRTGRRSWKLNFKGLRDYQIMGENETRTNTHQYTTATSNGTNYYTDDNEVVDVSNADDYWRNNLHTGENDDFFTNVLNKTCGGAEKFIFQPDKEDFSSLAIAKFDQSSFNFKQSNHKFFDIGLKIEEVW